GKSILTADRARFLPKAMIAPARYPHCNTLISAKMNAAIFSSDHSGSNGRRAVPTTARSKQAAKTDATRSHRPRRTPIHVTLTIAQSIRRLLTRPLSPSHGSLIYCADSQKTGIHNLAKLWRTLTARWLAADDFWERSKGPRCLFAPVGGSLAPCCGNR